MRQRILLDTGPLVALLKSQDQFHTWVKQELANIQPPLLTCDAVIAEACFLLRNTYKGEETILSLISDQYIQLSFDLSKEVLAVKELMILIGQYRCL